MSGKISFEFKTKPSVDIFFYKMEGDDNCEKIFAIYTKHLDILQHDPAKIEALNSLIMMMCSSHLKKPINIPPRCFDLRVLKKIVASLSADSIITILKIMEVTLRLQENMSQLSTNGKAIVEPIIFEMVDNWVKKLEKKE